MELSTGFLLYSMVLSVLSGPVPDSKALTILELMAQDNHVCNFPPKEMLVVKSKAHFLKPCRVEFEDDVSTEEQTENAARDDPSYLLCMGFYDTSVHTCQSGVPPSSLPKTSEEFVNLFDDETRADSFCSDLQQLEPLPAALNRTLHWVKVLNAFLADEQQCAGLCMSKRASGEVFVNHLCKVIAWGRNLIANNAKVPSDSIPEAQLTQLAEEDLTQNGDARLETDEPTSVSASKSNKSASPVSQPASSVSNAAPKSVPEPSSASAPVIKAEATPVVNKVEASSAQSRAEAPPAQGKIEASPAQNSSSKVSQATSPATKAALPDVSSPASKNKVEEPTKSASSSPVQTVSSSTSNQEINYNMQEEDIDGGMPIKGKGADEVSEYDGEEEDEAVLGKTNSIDFKSQSNVGFGPRELGNFSKKDAVENESNFYAYFLTVAIVCIAGYLLFHNKQKILALLLEGRRNNHSSRRRPNSSNYRKLDTNLEEAITSPAPRSTNSHVIY